MQINKFFYRHTRHSKTEASHNTPQNTTSTTFYSCIVTTDFVTALLPQWALHSLPPTSQNSVTPPCAIYEKWLCAETRKTRWLPAQLIPRTSTPGSMSRINVFFLFFLAHQLYEGENLFSLLSGRLSWEGSVSCMCNHAVPLTLYAWFACVCICNITNIKWVVGAGCVEFSPCNEGAD